MRDDDIRSSCFASLDVLCATHGTSIPYRGGLDQGFPFRGRRIPFLTPYKGIYRAAAQTGPAALSINTSWDSPYDDRHTDDGVLYAYRAGTAGEIDNASLRAAHALQVPIVYFVGTRPGFYQALYPHYAREDDPVRRQVLISPGGWLGPYDDREPIPIEDTVERRYAVRETRVRTHQARFRGLVLRAYSDRCTICRLKQTRLLDAAHIVGDTEATGLPVVVNGLSLCTIHHRAFDENLIGVSPDYEVHVADSLLDDEDGPMLELLKGFHRSAIELPQRRVWRPDRDRLALRFEQFRQLT